MSIQVEHLKMFIKFAAKELHLSSFPKIHFVGSSENAKCAFGHSIGKDITIRISERHPIDIMRTIAHELIHYKQNVNKAKNKEQFKEDQANAMAGRIMRKFDTTYPKVFKDKPIPAHLKETESAVPANSMGASSSTHGTGGIDTYDPLLTAKVLKRKSLKDIIGQKILLKNIKKEK